MSKMVLSQKITWKYSGEFTIVGRTGGGKSTLSNVLTESEDFKEMGAQLASQISREKGFELNGKSYNVVDSIRIGILNYLLRNYWLMEDSQWKKQNI